jgi:hypothetical protein
MITLINKDRFIYDLEYRVPDIIKEYQTTGKVEISVNNEGICLRKVKFYDLLDYVCDKFNFEKFKITIYTSNILEKHEFYNIKNSYSHWLYETKKTIPIDYVAFKNDNLLTLGCFVGKINWNRLILLSFLYKNFKDQILLTCHYRHEDAQKLQSELTELNFYDSDNLVNAVNFLQNCPLTLGESFETYTIGPPEHLTILNQYNRFFAELIIETYVMGNTFFPTEKTLRPIIAETPFIVMGPINYLDNLKKLGFKTFSQWWDESYDQWEGPNRIEKIKMLLTKIMSWSQERLQQTLKEMQTVLEYNRNFYLHGINTND